VQLAGGRQCTARRCIWNGAGQMPGAEAGRAVAQALCRVDESLKVQEPMQSRRHRSCIYMVEAPFSTANCRGMPGKAWLMSIATSL